MAAKRTSTHHKIGLPPVTAIVAPDVKLDSGSASMTYAEASSAGWAGLFIGVCLPKLRTASSGRVDGMSGVQTGPGATALARIPFSARSWANPAVKFWIAPFVVA